MFTKYAVEVGDTLWNALYSYIGTNFPGTDSVSAYRVEAILEEEGQKFAVLQSRADEKFYRLNFSLNEESEFIPSETLVEITSSYTVSEEPQFALEAVQEYEANYGKTEEIEDKNDETNTTETEKEVEEVSEELCPKCGKELKECECEKEEDIIENKYNLDEVVEYIELKAEFEELQNKFSVLEQERDSLQSQLEPLIEFKKAVDKKEKEDMIAQFYMLSDEDKADVIANIDNYSVDDIEAKLSIICVRNKVSFNLEEETNKGATTYNLNDTEDDSLTPAWIKAVIATSEKRN